MHCNSCVVLIEGELMEISEIRTAKSSLKNNRVEIGGDFGDKTPKEIAMSLSEVLKPHGYTLSVEQQKRRTAWSDFAVAVPVAAGFIGMFIILQKLGIVNLITSGEVGYGTAFLVGLIASVSSCMAVVGGLVLSMSANFAKGGDKVRPQVLFHISRLVAFFVLGGVVGAIGQVFQFGTTGIFILTLVVSVVLLILGINLLDVFPWAKKMQLTLPAIVGKRVQGLKNINHTLTPLLIGVATFFLPCGFTQSMQIYALSTGSFLMGAMTMFVFALGTLPVLALLSFSSLGVHTKTKSSVFFKTAGLIVIFFGVLNLLNGLAVYGIITPFFNL